MEGQNMKPSLKCQRNGERPSFTRFFPSGNKVASYASNTNNITIWDSKSEQNVLQLIGGNRVVIHFAISSDETQIAAGFQDYKIGIWNLSKPDTCQLI